MFWSKEFIVLENQEYRFNSWEEIYMAKFTVGNENHAPIELYYEDHGSGNPLS